MYPETKLNELMHVGSKGMDVEEGLFHLLASKSGDTEVEEGFPHPGVKIEGYGGVFSLPGVDVKGYGCERGLPTFWHQNREVWRWRRGLPPTGVEIEGYGGGEGLPSSWR